MPTTKDTEFDYQTYTRHHPPDPSQLQHGPQARQRRREPAKSRITIRIDTDVLDQFKQMVPDGQGYQSLINQALREWLIAQGVKELVQGELKEITAKAISSIQAASSSQLAKH